MRELGKKDSAPDRPILNENEYWYAECYQDLAHSADEQGRIPLSEIKAYTDMTPVPDGLPDFMHVIRQINIGLNSKD